MRLIGIVLMSIVAYAAVLILFQYGFEVERNSRWHWVPFLVSVGVLGTGLFFGFRKPGKSWASMTITALATCVLVIAADITVALMLPCPSSCIGEAQTSNLHFRASTCTSDAVMPFPPEITSQAWESTKELTVRARVPLNCGIGVVSGAHAIAGDRIELGYQGGFKQPRSAVAACYCSYSLTYRISGLEHKPYVLAIESMADEKNREKWSERLPK